MRSRKAAGTSSRGRATWPPRRAASQNLSARPASRNAAKARVMRYAGVIAQVYGDNCGMSDTLARNENNLVWIDCEMTGLDPEVEKLIEIAVIVTGPDLLPRIEGPVFVIHQSDEQLDKMDAWNKGTHGKSGLIDKVKASTTTEEQAQAGIIEFMP